MTNALAANKLRAAALALEAAERATCHFTATTWRNHASALTREARRLLGEVR